MTILTSIFAQGFGEMTPDLAGEILGTEYMRFSTFSVSGLVKVNNQRVDILVIFAKNPGCGQVRQFIKNIKNLYNEIHVWEIWNAVLSQALERYGFKYEKIIQDGEELEGMFWRKENHG